MSDVKAIILTHNTLEAKGLWQLLCESFDIDAHIGNENFFAMFNSSAEPDIFFIDQVTLVANLGFFLPRKAKTVILVNSNIVVDDMKTLDVTVGDSQMISDLNAILEADKKEDRSSSMLSAREIEVLRLIAMGYINKEIANELNISINTVLTHRKNLTSKLGIKSVSGLSFYAMMNGIV